MLSRFRASLTTGIPPSRTSLGGTPAAPAARRIRPIAGSSRPAVAAGRNTTAHVCRPSGPITTPRRRSMASDRSRFTGGPVSKRNSDRPVWISPMSRGSGSCPGRAVRCWTNRSSRSSSRVQPGQLTTMKSCVPKCFRNQRYCCVSAYFRGSQSRTSLELLRTPSIDPPADQRDEERRAQEDGPAIAPVEWSRGHAGAHRAPVSRTGSPRPPGPG